MAGRYCACRDWFSPRLSGRRTKIQTRDLCNTEGLPQCSASNMYVLVDGVFYEYEKHAVKAVPLFEKMWDFY
jgi:hypothetical protein